MAVRLESESPMTSKEDAYNQGYEDGKNSNALDEFSQALGESLNITPEDDAYDEGFHDGVKDK